MFLIFSTTLFFLLISTSNAHTQGTVTVDTLTFDKILRTFDIVLAKFDDKYRMYFKSIDIVFHLIDTIFSLAYGDHQDQFKKFAENAANTKRLLIVEIPITDHGDRENEQLAKEYGIKKEDYPVYKLFLKNKPKPIDYIGDRTEHDLKRFISQYTSKAD
jgi:endoplasmic reticulum protein 29